MSPLYYQEGCLIIKSGKGACLDWLFACWSFGATTSSKHGCSLSSVVTATSLFHPSGSYLFGSCVKRVPVRNLTCSMIAAPLLTLCSASPLFYFVRFQASDLTTATSLSTITPLSPSTVLPLQVSHHSMKPGDGYVTWGWLCVLISSFFHFQCWHHQQVGSDTIPP